jgi:hypothetical protein
MAFTVTISATVEADDIRTAALEGYKQIMQSNNQFSVVMHVTDGTGQTQDVKLPTDEANEYAALTGQRSTAE